MTVFKPMLAMKTPEDLSTIKLPALISVKLDGIRCMTSETGLLSRSLKPIANNNLQRALKGLPEFLDGELIVGLPTSKTCMRDTSSVVMSDDKPIDAVTYHVFDIQQGGRFDERLQVVKEIVSEHQNKFPMLRFVDHTLVHSLDELLALEEEALEQGHEGLVVRSPEGKYVHGRSCKKDGPAMIKLKQMEDAEAEILDCFEYETNTNAAFTNEIGRTARSSAMVGKVGAGVLGGFVVRGLNPPYENVIFRMGSGFSGADSPTGERARLWNNRQQHLGKIVSFRYFGVNQEKPRHPIFKSFRDECDL